MSDDLERRYRLLSPEEQERVYQKLMPPSPKEPETAEAEGRAEKLARARPSSMSPEAVARILTAVGPNRVPPDLDKTELAGDLEWSEQLYSSALKAKRGRGRRKRLEKVHKTAGDLLELLADEEVHQAVSANLGDCALALTQRLIDATNTAPTAAAAGRALAAAMSLDKRSEFDWLVGERLPAVFARHFGSRAGLGREKDNAPNSPFIRFAEAALKELGITNKGKPYSRESIIDAVMNARKGRVRRKSAASTSLGKTG